MSLRLRVWFGLGIIAVLVVVSSITTSRLVERSLIEQLDERLTSIPGGGRDFRPPSTTPTDRPVQQGVRVYYTALLVGTTIIRAEAAERGSTTLPAPKLDMKRIAALAAAKRSKPFLAPAVGTSDLEYRVSVRTDARSPATLVVAAPLDDIENSLSRLDQILLAITIAILGALVIVAWWMIRLGVRPVKRIAATASTIADPANPFDLSKRVDVAARGTEVGDLGRAFNTMLDRLEDSFEEQRRIETRLRQFASDASHELRTPVQTIRGYAELYRFGALAEPGQLDDAMRRTEQESVRMAALVDDLLTLARFDNARPLQQLPVNLASLARDAVSDARAVQPTRSITAVAPNDVDVIGDEHSLRQIISNVVGNALTHTPLDAAIRISIEVDENEAVVVVSDDGPGMPVEVAEHAFERFVRADASRNRKAGGSGLGLAIVQAAVEAHDGTVTLQSVVGEGTTITIRVPIEGPELVETPVETPVETLGGD